MTTNNLNKPDPVAEDIAKIICQFGNSQLVMHRKIKKMIEDLAAYTTNKIIGAIDHIYELSPTKNFEHWKPQDALAFYERLKAYEAELKALTKGSMK